MPTDERWEVRPSIKTRDFLDEQAVCFDMCLKTMNQCIKDRKKRTIIIQGGPGTGKSVLAVNLLMEFINQGLNASYVTKNSAPREAFLKLLTQGSAMRLTEIRQLFRSPFGLHNCDKNGYDCLIIDEAHRLVKKMFQDWCDELGSRVILKEETKLLSQFRCNGSDAYIQFIDDILQRCPETISIDLSELNFDFKVFDDPCEMRDALRTKNQIDNKSRMVAGYCYDWNVKHRRGDWDIMIQDSFKAKWNLENDRVWAINPYSFEEVGCIHTAQGLEFDYVGVLIGKDLTFNPDTRMIETRQEAISKDDKSSGIRTASAEKARQLILNTYKTLLTRGQKGCYLYCEDKELSNYIKSKL